MTSRLAEAASPYLRAHAGNPVAWYPWGAEAFAEAARRDVPVMVSIGYSTCHWCHVMARESFEDPQTARELNDAFVPIKVDREEHPEVDDAFLAAASAFTPHLGWPLTVFTTPQGRAFFAGTYFPPQPQGGVPAFRQVLAAVGEAWAERRGEITATADAVAEALTAAAVRPGASDPPDAAALADAARLALAREDRRYGGFGAPDAPLGTPKFPTVPALRFLQSPALADEVPDAAAAASRSLDAMAASPLRDAVDGGFFRYATRRDWTVPHYERMLTDNAGLLEVALDAGASEVARGIAGFLIDTMQRESGGFAAAQDSESWIEGARSEGGFYLRAADERVRLEPPDVDGKVVTGWNGLAIAALARAGVRLGDAGLVAAARWAADAVLETNVGADGRLVRASLDEIASRAPATLEDYGALAEGLAVLAAATGEAAYAVRARALVDACLGDGAPEPPGGRDPVLAAHGIPGAPGASDGDHPSGPSAFASAALALWRLGAGERYRDAATAVVRVHAAAALAEPLANGAMLRVAAQLAVPPRQVVVVGGADAEPLRAAARTLAADAVAFVTAHQAAELAAAGFALFEGKAAATATAFDCRAFACRLPTGDPASLLAG